MKNNYDFKEIEKQAQQMWDEKTLKAMTSYDSKKKLFSWLEGPPTANAPPGLHHVEVRVFKDVMCRFKYMQGYTVPRKGGWDCHGLPVEVQVEKKLGLKTKKDVLKYGIAKFNKECKEDIFRFIKDWEIMTNKLAFVVDLDNPYRTLDNEYIESVWWSLKELFTKGHLYEGHKVVPYCPRCETPLSSHEVALGYKDVTENSITIEFQSKDNPKQYFLAWTTTPWTLPSNMSLAVNPEIDYATVSQEGKEYVLAAKLASKYFPKTKPTKTFKGKEIIGKKYVPLFPYFEKLDKAFVIVPEEYVSIEEGTGIVHQTPAFGEIDFESCKKHGIPFTQPVDVSGKYTEEVTDFKGIFVKDADPKIIEHLKNKGKLFGVHKTTHSYPFCWRCNTPLLYYALVSWFINVSTIRDKLLKHNKKIKWVPEHIQEGRFGNWLEGAKDWAISRHKFWGTPLPIWRCQNCKKTEAIGSVEELRKRGKNVPKELDLHKPAVDDITLTCTCGKEMRRIPDVVDCWYDSGSAPFAQFHYPFENKELFQKRFPYDYIVEAIDQTRGWFYTLHVLSTLLFDNVSYKMCAVGGLLCDEKGDKMSKSKGNIVMPLEIFDKVGVDAVRLLMCSYPLGENVKFGFKPIKEQIQPFLTILWNSAYYAHEFLTRHNLPGTEHVEPLPMEDNWIISRINTLITNVTNALDEAKYSEAIAALSSFTIDDFSRTYIKLIRDRTNEKDDALAYTLVTVIQNLIKLVAPLAPYLSEALYRQFNPTNASVHLEKWPIQGQINRELENKMNIIKEIISSANSAREKAQIGLRWPIASVEIVTKNEDVSAAIEDFEELLLKQLNTKKIHVHAKWTLLKETIEVNTAVISEKLGKDADKIIKKLQKTEMIEKPIIDGIEISSEFYTIKREYPKHFIESTFTTGQVYINTERTDELEAEGLAREIIRRIQQLRKDAKLTKKDFVNVYIRLPENIQLIRTQREQLTKQCGIRTLLIGSHAPSKSHTLTDTSEIRDIKIEIHVDKITDL